MSMLERLLSGNGATGLQKNRVAQFRGSIAHRFDESYVRRTKRVYDALDFLGWFFDSVDVSIEGERITELSEQSEELRQHLGSSGRVVYIANHLSHADYIAMGHLFMQNGIKLPRFAAGANLDLPLLKLIGLDFRRMGAFFIDRDLAARADTKDKKAYFLALKKTIRTMLDKREHLFVFPDGGRRYDGGVMPDESKVKKRVFEIAVDYSSQTGNSVTMVPVAIGYNRRVEEIVFPLLGHVNQRRNILERGAYYLLDAAAIASWPIARALGFYHPAHCYINIGTPRAVSDIVNTNGQQPWQQLRHHAVEQIRRLYAGIRDQMEERGH